MFFDWTNYLYLIMVLISIFVSYHGSDKYICIFMVLISIFVSYHGSDKYICILSWF